jgi:spore maturation protein CgeB
MNLLIYEFPSGAPDQLTTSQNIQDALFRMGHNLIIPNPIKEVGKGKEQYQYDGFIVDYITGNLQKENIDLFFSSVRDNEISVEAIEQIKKLGIPTVNLSYDHILVPYRVKKIAKAFDLYWVPEPGPDAVAKIKKYGGNIYHAPVAANPSLYHPHECQEDIQVSFCGTAGEGRSIYIHEILKYGIPIQVFGLGWNPQKDAVKESSAPKRSSRLQIWPLAKHIGNSLLYENGRKWLAGSFLRRMKMDVQPDLENMELLLDQNFHSFLPFEDMVKLYSRSKLSLGINELGYTYYLKDPIYSVRLRDFEAPMSGACHIMHRNTYMGELYEEGKEMLFYSSMEELLDLTQFYVRPKNDSERMEIKKKARARSLKEHTWDNRFSGLFSALKIG